MSKERFLIDALKDSNTARKVVIDRLLQELVEKDSYILELKLRISLLKQWILLIIRG
jgi:hypothetical protein